MATVHEGNKLFDAQSVKGNIDNNNNVIRDTVNTGSQPSGSNALRSDIDGGNITLNNTTIEQNGLLGNDNESYRIVVIGSQDIRFPVSDSGYIEDGTGENPLRPVVYDGDIISIYTIRGAVISLILETNGKYNDSIYNTIIALDKKDILSHISVTDKNVESDSRMIVVNGYVDGEDVILYYIEHKDISGDYEIYKVILHKNGEYTRTHNNTATGFYRVGSDGTFWEWDEELKSYVSTGIEVVGNLYDIRLFSANGSQFVRAGQQVNIIAEVWNMDKNITDNVAPESFSWQRSSGNVILDNLWNQTHVGVGKTIQVTNADINKSCTFYCLVPIDVLKQVNN